jgi:hypothetical protein
MREKASGARVAMRRDAHLSVRSMILARLLRPPVAGGARAHTTLGAGTQELGHGFTAALLDLQEGPRGCARAAAVAVALHTAF